jgi:Ca2+-binding RTX toxin-like protein
LSLEGTTANDQIYGTSDNDVIYGLAGFDYIDGRGGADTMIGGKDSDTYVVDNVSDLIVEAFNEGTTDMVRSSLSYSLTSNVERLTLTGSTAINGYGNDLANLLIGNGANNLLVGAAGNDSISAGNGNDVLDGGVGNDLLTGGNGNDTYLFGRGDGLDTVSENDATVGNTDIAQFKADIANDQLWFSQVGNNLEVSIIGTTDKFSVQNWFIGTQYQLEQFKSGNGKTLLNTQVQNLVQAMAAFSPPAAGQTTLPTNYATTLNPIIAANWQ